MKRFLRLAWVQSTLAFLLVGYVRLVTATMRWRFDQTDTIASEMTDPQGGMLFFWHGRIALAVTCRRLIKERPFRPMISLSPDGAFISRAAAQLGALAPAEQRFRLTRTTAEIWLSSAACFS